MTKDRVTTVLAACTGKPLRQAVTKLLPSIRFDDLRRTHATISITLDTYSHAIPAMQEEAAALIAGLVFDGT